MNKKQEQQILDYYSTTDKYIHSKTHSNAHQTVFTKESDKYQWLVLEQKSQCEVEVRQTDSHGTITARDNYELTRNLPKCVSVERLCEGVNFQIPFNTDEINLIYQFGEQSKAKTCASLSAILPQIKDNNTKQIVSTTLNKLNALSEKTCAELTATTKRHGYITADHQHNHHGNQMHNYQRPVEFTVISNFFSGNIISQVDHHTHRQTAQQYEQRRFHTVFIAVCIKIPQNFFL